GGGADDMGNRDQGDGNGHGPGRAGSGEQQDGGAGGQRRADPPELAREQVGGGHAGQFGRQPIGGGEHEGGEAGGAPDPAGAGIDGQIGEGGDAPDQEGEAGGGQQVGQHRVGGAFGPVLGSPFPGFDLRLMVVRVRPGAMGMAGLALERL